MECEAVKREHPEVYFEFCCVSCHEDDENGYGDDLWFDVFGRDRHVCCAVSRSVERYVKKEAVHG